VLVKTPPETPPKREKTPPRISKHTPKESTTKIPPKTHYGWGFGGVFGEVFGGVFDKTPPNGFPFK